MSTVERSGGRQRPGKVAILRAAVTVMGEDGYEGASMRDIAARAGVSAAAIYYHFSSKHDMLREFLEDAWRIALERIDRRLGDVPDVPEAQLDELVATLVAAQHHDEYARLASLVALREHPRLHPEDRERIEHQQHRLLERVAGVVRSGVESGAFGAVDPMETARVILAITTPWAVVASESAPPLQELIETSQRFARRLVGMAAPSGRAASART